MEETLRAFTPFISNYTVVSIFMQEEYSFVFSMKQEKFNCTETLMLTGKPFISCEPETVVDFIMFLMYNTKSFQHYLLYHQHIYEGEWNRAE
jgi:hypothetical protein